MLHSGTLHMRKTKRACRPMRPPPPRPPFLLGSAPGHSRKSLPALHLPFALPLILRTQNNHFSIRISYFQILSKVWPFLDKLHCTAEDRRHIEDGGRVSTTSFGQILVRSANINIQANIINRSYKHLIRGADQRCVIRKR